MRFLLAAAAVLFAIPASAEPKDTYFHTTVPDRPASIGIPHSCADDYPKTALKVSAQGTTTLAFRITAAGKVKGITVKTSSGDKDLDDAATRCVARWLYKPARKNGVAVEIPWMANVVWKLGQPMAVRIAAQCLKYRRSPLPIPSQVGMTSIGFRVMQDGSVNGATLVHSSGDKSLDEAALLCAKSSHYNNSTLTLPPEGLSGHAEMDWSHIPQTPPVPLSSSK